MSKYFKNITSTSADFYVYGDILDDRTDWWTGERNENGIDIDPEDMKKELDDLQNKGITDFNIYINSGGGSVFASSTMVSLLKRFKTNTGAKIHSYIDGLCASAATYLCMCADDINIYQNSIMMIHKPMSIALGNADDFQKEIDTLNTIENDMMIPMYLNKSKVDEEELKNLISNETWFSGNENDKLYIGNFFKVNYLDETKEAVASISTDLFKNYKNTPKKLKDLLTNNEPKQQTPVDNNINQEPDYWIFEKTLNSLKREEK